MTNTDRAFIAALQQADATSAGSTRTAAGPHYSAHAHDSASVASRPKAPLSEHLARRNAAAQQHGAAAQPTAPPRLDGPLAPGVELDSLRWPEVADQLAQAGRETLVSLLATLAGRSPSETPVVALVGARPGVGATAVLLALARIVRSVGGTTAILDISCEATGAAGQLGVRRVGSREGIREPLAVDDRIVASLQDNLSVLTLGADAAAGLVGRSIERLAATHDLVLIDAGDAAHAAQTLGPVTGASPVMVIADAAPAGTAAIDTAVRTLGKLEVAGVVETFAPAAA